MQSGDIKWRADFNQLSERFEIILNSNFEKVMSDFGEEKDSDEDILAKYEAVIAYHSPH